jgi:Fic family protein
MEKKFHFSFGVTQEIIKKIGFIDSFKGKWEAIQREENKYLKELRKLATIQSIGSSTRIEGATLTNEEIATLLENLQINKLETRDEQEAIGYYEVLEIILEQHEEITLNEPTIFSLHNLLLKFSDKDTHHRGQYKTLSNKVVATYPGGEQRVIFNTTDPFLVKKEMESLLLWYHGEIKNGSMHPLLCIGGLVYEFLSIHPFQDGNGRLSRLLTSLLLLQNGYDFIQYISFENQIESTRKKYYQVLMNAQQHRNTDQEIIDDWILYFLGSIEALISKLENKYERYKSIGPYLNERQREIIDFIGKNEPVKVSDISTALAGYSIHSIKKDLQYLYQENVIDRLGKGRGTTYFSVEKEE